MKPLIPNKEVCLNEKCAFFRKSGGGNIIKVGKDRNGRQKYRCTKCKKYFIETKGTVFYNKKKMKENEIILVCKLFAERNSIRAIERITGHHRDTIGGLLSDLALHAKEVNEFFLKDIKMGEMQIDEFWTFVKKSKRTLSKEMIRSLGTAGVT
jgi:phage FluMu protein Com